MPPIYDRADMQHLTAVDHAQAILAWHTGLDIQAIQPATGQAMLVIAGHEIAHRHPEMAVFHFALQKPDDARAHAQATYGISL